MANQESLVNTAEWFAEVGGLVGGLILAKSVIAGVSVRYEKQQLEKIKASLPAIDSIDPSKLAEGAKGSISPFARRMLMELRVQVELGYADDELPWYRSLQTCTREMTDTLRDTLGYNTIREKSERTAGVVETAYVLDQAMPINPQDSLTPEYVGGERHWFDFVYQKAKNDLMAA